MHKHIISLGFFILVQGVCVHDAAAFWIWTPETNKWENPKYSVKDTPSEQLQAGVSLFEAGQFEKAVREFQKLILHYPLAREAPEAQYFIGRAWEAQERPYQAFKEYQVVVEKYPFSERSSEIVQRQFDIGVMLLEGKEKRNKFVETVVGDNYAVIDIFKAVIKNAPYGKLAPEAQYKIGLYLLEKQLYQEARDEFEKVMNDYPETEWAKAARFQIAIADAKRSTDAQYDQKITKAAVEEFHDFVKDNPEAELSKNAKEQIAGLRNKEAENVFIIAQFYEKRRNYAAARIYYQTVVDDYRNSQWASPALEKIRELGGRN